MAKNLLRINVSETGITSNFKKKFPQIPENELSNMKIKRILKQAIFLSILSVYSPPSTFICAPSIGFTFDYQGLFN